MLKCWSYRPEDRPTFRYCLDVLQSLRSNYENIHINMENTHRNLIAGKPNITNYYISIPFMQYHFHSTFIEEEEEDKKKHELQSYIWQNHLLTNHFHAFCSPRWNI